MDPSETKSRQNRASHGHNHSIHRRSSNPRAHQTAKKFNPRGPQELFSKSRGSNHAGRRAIQMPGGQGHGDNQHDLMG